METDGIKAIRPDISIILTTGFTEELGKWADLDNCRLAFKPVVIKDMARYMWEALTP